MLSWYIYLIDIAHNLHIICAILLIIWFIATIAFTPFIFAGLALERLEPIIYRKWFSKTNIIIIIIMINIVIWIPSKNTMIQMYIIPKIIESNRTSNTELIALEEYLKNYIDVKKEK